MVAYEPVWAIGTGLTPTAGDVAEMHGVIRARLSSRFGGMGQGMRILYGGSVKPSNARELLSVADVDGALVGGASLKAEEFLAIVGAAADDETCGDRLYKHATRRLLERNIAANS